MSGSREEACVRDEVRAAACRLVITRGEGVTPADVAAELGVPVGDLALADRDDVLIAALLWSHRGIARRFFGLTAGHLGAPALRAAIVDHLPLDETRLLETELELAVWHRSRRSPKVAEAHHRERVDLLVLLRGALRDTADNGELVAGLDIDETAERLLALVDGLSLHVLLYPDQMSADTARNVLTEELDRILRDKPTVSGY